MIKVLHSGIYTAVQDKGRVGYASLGVPQSGFMDVYSASIGNALLKNPRNTSVIEIAFGFAKFEFKSEQYICLTGADFSAKINQQTIDLNTVYRVNKDDVLSFGKRKYGVRTYLAVQGGIQTEEILQSRSSTLGINQVKLLKEDEVSVLKMEDFIENSNAKIKVNEAHFISEEVDCLPGPEYELLTNNQKKALQNEFSISEDNNRMGYRLNEKIENTLTTIITSAVLPGTVQLTPSGQLIVLMKDCQVTGGYPRVLQLTDYAVSKLSQKTTQDKIKFQIR